jgi:hypothetical protein
MIGPFFTVSYPMKRLLSRSRKLVSTVFKSHQADWSSMNDPICDRMLPKV